MQFLSSTTEQGNSLIAPHHENQRTIRQIILEANPECQGPDHVVPEDTFHSMPDWSEALFAVGNIIVLIFSICGNVGALVVLFKSQVSKLSTKLYLVSLAICDLTLALTSPTVDLSQLLSRYRSWVLGGFLCKAIPFLQTAAVLGVALFLVMIAGERYLYVVRAFKQSRATSLRNVVPPVIVILSWILSIGFALPNLWYYQQESFWTFVLDEHGNPYRPRNETCKTYYICLRTTFDTSNVAYYSVLGLAFFIPTFCFLFCYISILVFIRRHAAVMTGSGTLGSETRMARNRKTLRLILGLICLNVFCRFPVWCFVVITNIKETQTTTAILFLFYGFHLLSNINSMINPFLYAIFNDAIRTTRNSSCAPPTSTPGDNGYSCLKIFTSCCYRQFKVSPADYFRDRRNKGNYDFTKTSKFIPSISTQKFNISDKTELPTPSPRISSNLTS